MGGWETKRGKQFKDLQLALMCSTTSRVMNEEEPPFKRRRRMTILMLPYDVILNCLARISRLYYPTLSLVSKRFRSLLSSKELYQTRTLLRCTESCLYVCLRDSSLSDSNPPRWFTLIQRPSSPRKILVPTSSLNFPSAQCSKVAAVGPNIYSIGGVEHNMSSKASSSVMVMDCRSHTWCEAPRMQVARSSHSVCVHDGNIYVTGGDKNLDSTNWIEVFNTKTQTWEFSKISGKELHGDSQLKSVWYEGTLYVRSDEKDVTYKLHNGRWREVDYAMNSGWGRSSSYCVVENVFYRYCGGKIDWFDSEERSWKCLKGLEFFIYYLPKKIRRVKLVDYGEKIAVLWEWEDVKFCSEKLIKCAEIVIERRQKDEIWGMWLGVVFQTNTPFNSLAHAIAITL